MTCYIVVSGISYSTSCTVNTGIKTVYMTGFTGSTTAGAQLALTFTTFTNPADSASSTQSMGLTSYTDNTYAYTIDNIATNLVPGLACNYPCATCLSTDKSSCVSCDSTGTYPYL